MTDDASRDETDATARDRDTEPETPPQPQPARHGFWWRVREYTMVVAIAIALSFLVKTFLVQPFWIPSGSMEQTLITGDRIVVNKLPGSNDDLQRGDIVVFEDPNGWLPPVPESEGVGGAAKRALQFVGLYPAGEQHLVKRVIGVGGDHVVCCDDRGRITVNGAAIDETYLSPGVQPSAVPFDVRVPEGRLWVMGDNRSNSEDSRAHDGRSGGSEGSVPTSVVTGKVWAVVWPIGRFGTPPDGRAVFSQVPSR